MPARRASAGRSVGTRPGPPLMRSAWPSAPSAMPWGRRPTVTSRPASPAKPRPAASTTRQPPRLRPGRAPIRRPDPLIAASIRPHARSTGRSAAPCGPLGTVRRLSDAHQQPGGAPISPDRPPPRPAQPMSPTARPRGQHAIASSPARASRLRDPRHPHPRHPRSVPARPPSARTHSRAYDRRVFGFRVLGSGLDFGIEKLGWGSPVREPGAGGSGQGPPAIGGIGRWDPPEAGRLGTENERLLGWDPRGERWPTLWSPNRLRPLLMDHPHACSPRVARDNSLAVVSSPFTNLPGRVAQAKLTSSTVPARIRSPPRGSTHRCQTRVASSRSVEVKQSRRPRVPVQRKLAIIRMLPSLPLPLYSGGVRGESGRVRVGGPSVALYAITASTVRA